MHIAQTVKANVPPSSSVPGGGQHRISLTRENNLGRAVFFSVNEKAVKPQTSLPHEELKGKTYKPKLRCKAKKEFKYRKTGNRGTSKNVE